MPILLLSTHQLLGLLSASFLMTLPPISYMYSYLMRATFHTNLFLLDLIILIMLDEEYKLRIHHYAGFSNLMLLQLSLIEIFSTALCSQMPSVCVLPLIISSCLTSLCRSNLISSLLVQISAHHSPQHDLPSVSAVKLCYTWTRWSILRSFLYCSYGWMAVLICIVSRVTPHYTSSGYIAEILLRRAERSVVYL
jgi:hypothetical protein